ncbi:MAG: hypothetical protein ACLFRD_10690 [Nitriliruptoraceae bacterium]
MAATLCAIVASVAPWGTDGRLAVVLGFAVAVVALVGVEGEQGRWAWVVAAAVVFVIVSGLHVALTSPSAAWVVDSHMVPWVPRPGGMARLVIAWSSTLGWTALVAVAASQIPTARTRPVVTVLLGLAAMLPLFNPGGFPVDSYELLWNRSTFAHPSFTVALIALFAATALLARQSSVSGDRVRSPGDAPLGRAF